MEVKQTGVEWLYDQIENEGKCIYEVIEQAKKMDDEFLEKLKDFDTWKEWKNSSMKIKETKFGTYVETESSTKLTGDKITRFVERLKKIGIDVKLSGNFPWVYIDEICGIRVTEKFEANHGFTLIFLPGRNDSPVSEFTDITEIFKLIRKYSREARLIQMMKDDEENGLYEEI
jgi:oligoribonuclease NrnB/cAMP/cGMP phosphodiesterase (DHH superfamily)